MPKTGPSRSPAVQRRWLHFWADDTAASVWEWAPGKGPNPIGSIDVPYGRGKIAVGDALYLVHVNYPGTRFTLLGRLEARRLITRRDGKETVGVVAKRGTATRQGPRILADYVIDAVTFRHRDSSEHRVKRHPDGTVIAGQFQGRASVRELVSGAEQLEAALAAQAW